MEYNAPFVPVDQEKYAGTPPLNNTGRSLEEDCLGGVVGGGCIVRMRTARKSNDSDRLRY